jgi:biopolymer transport protein ExbD
MEATPDELAQLRYRRALSRKKRRDRERAAEVRELNITAMMDIMTIILVFLLKAYSTSAVSMTASEDVHPPVSSTRLTPHDTVAVTVTPHAILVGDKRVVELEHGQVPKALMHGRRIEPLSAALAHEVEKLKYIAARNPGAQFSHELSVIGDRSVPYDLLLSVLYTAGQNELENYRFVVLQQGEQGTPRSP